MKHEEALMMNAAVFEFGLDLIGELATYPTGLTEPPCEEHIPLVNAMAVVVAAKHRALDLDLARSILMAAYRLGQISKED
jgi:hypothetical protein